VRTWDEAVLGPCLRHPGRIRRVVTRFGRHDKHGRPIGSWPLLISLDTTLAVHSRRGLPADPDHEVAEAIYAGLFYAGFGHFITETLPNLLAVAEAKRQNPDIKLLFHTPAFFRSQSQATIEGPLSRHVEFFLDLIGLDLAGSILVDRPMRVRRLLVPESPFQRKFRYKPWLCEGIDALLGPCAPTGQKVYLSRSRWPKPRIYDEDRAEAVFREHGYDIVHPQDLGLAEQIALVRGASALAGPQGTALHWSLYSANCRNVVSLGWPSPLQKGICKIRGQVYLDPRGRRRNLRDTRVREVSHTAIERAIAATEG
jgi:hypothetical protein